MIIFINGSINAGKTTIARLLTEKLSNTANVEIDNLNQFIGWMPIDKAVPYNLENAVSVITNFARRGMNVVVPYPLSQKNYEYMKNGLAEFTGDLYFFTLSPDINKALTSTEKRQLDEWETNRIKHHYEIGIPRPAFGITIDNTKQTPEETLREILSYLKRG